MQFIKVIMLIIFLGYSVLGTAASNDNGNYLDGFSIDCSDYNSKVKYNTKEFDIVECNNGTTMQNNKFYMLRKIDNIMYILDDISFVLLNGDRINYKEKGLVASMIKGTEMCNVDVQQEYNKNVLYLFSRIPKNNSYCYSINGYVDRFKIHKEFDGLNVKILTKIARDKVNLFMNNNIHSKTKMYLIKNDIIEIIEEKDNWLHVIYKGKRNIVAWIPTSSIK